MSSERNPVDQSGNKQKTHTHNRQCPICKGLCIFAQLNSAEAPYEEIEAELRRRRRLERPEE